MFRSEIDAKGHVGKEESQLPTTSSIRRSDPYSKLEVFKWF